MQSQSASGPSALDPRHLLDALPAAVMVLSPEGNLRYINQAMEIMTGFSPAEVTGASCLSLIETADHGATLTYLKDLISGKHIHHFEPRFKKKSGGSMYTSWTGRWDQQDQLLYVVLRDATERQQRTALRARHEHELERTTGEIKEMLERIQDGFSVLDQDWHITYANQQTEKILGRPLVELLGRNIWDCFPQAVGTPFEQCYRKAATEQVPVHFEAYYPEPLQKWFSLSVYPSPTGISVFHKDITAQKHSEAQREAYENKLHEQYSRYQEMLERITDAFFAVDQDWMISYWNKQAERISGKTRGEMMGKNFWDCFPQRVGTPSEKEFRRAFEEQVPVFFESPSVLQQHQLLEFSLYPSENGLTVFYRDITQRRKAEEEMRKLSLIAKETTDAVCLVDLELRICWVNEAYEKITGFAREEVIGKRNTEILGGPATDLLPVEGMKQYVAAGKPFEGEVLAYTKAKEPRWLNTRGHPLRSADDKVDQYFIIFSDITEHKNKMRQIQRLSTYLEKTRDLMVVTDDRGRIRWVNESFEKTTGYSIGEISGNELTQLMKGARTQMTAIEHIRQHIAKGAPFEAEFLSYPRTGRPQWLQIYGEPFIDDDGRVVEYFTIQHNITERKRLQRRLQQEVQHRQRAVTAAVIQTQERERAEVSQELHDNVNQVLTTVKLYQDLVLAGTNKQEALVRKSMELLQASIDEIRSLSRRLSAPSLGKIKLKDSIQELIASVSSTHKVAIALNTSGIAELEVNKEVHLAVYRILQEQLTNVLKYAAATEVKVVLGHRERELVLLVRDNGKGFDPESKRTGVGITNMITRTESLQGQFHIQSAPGKGCLLKVQLPLRS